MFRDAFLGLGSVWGIPGTTALSTPPMEATKRMRVPQFRVRIEGKKHCRNTKTPAAHSPGGPGEWPRGVSCTQEVVWYILAPRLPCCPQTVMEALNIHLAQVRVAPLSEVAENQLSSKTKGGTQHIYLKIIATWAAPLREREISE